MIRSPTQVFAFFMLAGEIDSLDRLLEVLHCLDPWLGQTVTASNPRDVQEAWQFMHEIVWRESGKGG